MYGARVAIGPVGSPDNQSGMPPYTRGQLHYYNVANHLTCPAACRRFSITGVFTGYVHAIAPSIPDPRSTGSEAGSPFALCPRILYVTGVQLSAIWGPTTLVRLLVSL